MIRKLLKRWFGKVHQVDTGAWLRAVSPETEPLGDTRSAEQRIAENRMALEERRRKAKLKRHLLQNQERREKIRRVK